jgi:predicted dehydrogenase
MTSHNDRHDASTTIDSGRRRILQAAGVCVVASAITRVSGAEVGAAGQADRPLRWGIVGTGGIANGMASMIKLADRAELAAVASRKMETAKIFAEKHGVPNAFASWSEMLSSDAIDAVYVATPTAVREEVCVSAASKGKHVLGEKPFANLPSLRRITAACRKHGVGFMDGTHFVHHPRTAQIKAALREKLGVPWTIDSTFQFLLPNGENIRLDPALEPYGALGDAGWYNMRAAVEYTAPGVKVIGADAYVRRDQKNKAAVSASGIMAYSDGSTHTWNCGFEAGAANMELRLSGPGGQLTLRDFVITQGEAEYEFRKGGFGPGATTERPKVPSVKPGAALMFEHFATMVGDPSLFEASVVASEKTQEWLDIAWARALKNEHR